MKYIIAVLALISLMAGCGAPEDSQATPDTAVDAGQHGQQVIEQQETSDDVAVDEVEQVEDDLDLGELDAFDEDLAEIVI